MSASFKHSRSSWRVPLGDDPLLRPVRDWTWEDAGLCIGCGGYFQGSLTIQVSSNKSLLEGKVVDRDDYGGVRARYANLGAFVDALLGD